MRRLDIDQLVDTGSAPVASVLLELEDGGDEFLHARAQKRLSELLHEAEDLLRDAGLSPAQAAATIEPARSVLDSPRPRSRRGLAVYLRDGHHYSFDLVDPVADRVVVGDRPVLLPLMREMEVDDEYVVLALDRKAPRLFTGSADDIRELDDARLPTLDDIRASDDVEPALTLHSSSTSPSGGASIHHGHGGSKDLEGQQFQRWIRAVAAAVDERLARLTAPVVIVGVAEQVVAFRRVATHPRLVETEVHGSPQAFSPTQLRERAWPIVRELRAGGLERDLERLVAHRGTAWVPDGVEAVCQAAERRQVDVLFASLESGAYERFVEDAALATWRAGGRIHVVDGTLPGGDPAAAILRYVTEPR